MAIQKFLQGGFYGKVGKVVGQRHGDAFMIRTWVRGANPQTVPQQAQRMQFAHATYLAQLAMNINGHNGEWVKPGVTEFAQRVGTARRRLQAGLPDADALPLHPDGWTPPTVWEMSSYFIYRTGIWFLCPYLPTSGETYPSGTVAITYIDGITLQPVTRSYALTSIGSRTSFQVNFGANPINPQYLTDILFDFNLTSIATPTQWTQTVQYKNPSVPPQCIIGSVMDRGNNIAMVSFTGTLPDRVNLDDRFSIFGFQEDAGADYTFPIYNEYDDGSLFVGVQSDLQFEAVPADFFTGASSQFVVMSQFSQWGPAAAVFSQWYTVPGTASTFAAMPDVYTMRNYQP